MPTLVLLPAVRASLRAASDYGRGTVGTGGVKRLAAAWVAGWKQAPHSAVRDKMGWTATVALARGSWFNWFGPPPRPGFGAAGLVAAARTHPCLSISVDSIWGCSGLRGCMCGKEVPTQVVHHEEHDVRWRRLRLQLRTACRARRQQSQHRRRPVGHFRCDIIQLRTLVSVSRFHGG